MVTARSLRRAVRRNPAAVKVAAGVLAGAVGMTTAAYGVFHIVQPYKGNGVRSDPSAQEEQAASPTDALISSVLDIVLADLSTEIPVDESLLFTLPELDIVTSVIDGTTTTPTNGVIAPAPGDGSGGNGGNGGLLPWNGGGTITPPSGGNGGGGRDVVTPVNVGPAVGGVAQVIGAESPTVPCAVTNAGTTEAPLLGIGGSQPPAEEAPAEEAPAPAEGEEAPAEGEQAPESSCGAPAPTQAG